jgi:purine-nucleoside phosphorylase
MSPDAMSAKDAVTAIRAEVGDFQPEVLVMLGSGLAEAAHSAEIYHTTSYIDIPGMVAPQAAGHPGRLLFGVWGNRKTLIFQGRIHRYEGRPWHQITLPVQIAADLGITTCIFTNMSGALSRRMPPGTLVVVDDHINFMGSNPLLGVTANDPNVMFPDMREAYSSRLRRLLDEAAAMHSLPTTHGIYVGVSGPNYETPAEVRALQMIGGDVVGMSTVGEVLVARQLGMECCAISCVANYAAGLDSQPIRHQDVLKCAREVAFQLSLLLESLLRTL